MALYVSEADVRRVIQMKDLLPALEQALRDFSSGEAALIPRQRLKVPKGIYRTMSGALPNRGVICTRMGSHRFDGSPGAQPPNDVVTLFSSQTADLLAIFCSSSLGDYRAGAVSAVASRYMARPDAWTVAVLGSGKQARTQLMGIAGALPLAKALVYSPTRRHRLDFCNEMSALLGLRVEPTDTPRQAVEVADVVVDATNAPGLVMDGNWLRQGTHVITIRSGYHFDLSSGKERRVIDDSTLSRSEIVVVDSKEQAVLQGTPELAPLIEEDRVAELHEVVAGKKPGRTNPNQVTLFNSFGTALADAAVVSVVYQKAVEQGLGIEFKT
jgi:ornithine cyclodeaminase/alanine dehydrogenase-like protein (mu-crystallin family)